MLRWYQEPSPANGAGRRRAGATVPAPLPVGGPGRGAGAPSAEKSPPALRTPVPPSPTPVASTPAPSRRKGPAVALRVSGLTGKYEIYNGDYRIEGTGRFRQCNGGQGVLFYSEGAWRFGVDDGSGTTLASCPSLLGQWKGQGEDAGEAPLPYIVATETRPEESPSAAPEHRHLSPPRLLPSHSPRRGWQSPRHSAHENQPVQGSDNRLCSLLQEECLTANRLVDSLRGDLQRQREAFDRERAALGQELEDRKKAHHEAHCQAAALGAELEAEIANHNKTAAGATAMITAMQTERLEAEEAEARLLLKSAWDGDLMALVMWHLAAVQAQTESALRTAVAERTANEAVTQELGEKADELQRVRREVDELKTEVAAERLNHRKTAYGAEHLAKELEKWRVEVRDTMQQEEAAMARRTADLEARLKRAQESEAQALRLVKLAEDHKDHLRVELDQALQKAAACEATQNQLLAEMREQLEATKESAATEARIREALSADLKEARRQLAETGKAIRGGLALQLEHLAAASQLATRPPIEEEDLDNVAITVRLEELTQALAARAKEQELNAAKEAERLQKLNAAIAAQREQIEQLQSELSLAKREGEKAKDLEEASERQIRKIEELSRELADAQGESEKRKELEVKLAALGDYEESQSRLRSLERQLADLAPVAERAEEAERKLAIALADAGRVEELTVELAKMKVEQGLLSQLSGRIQELEGQVAAGRDEGRAEGCAREAELTAALTDATAKIKALEESSAREKEMLLRHVADLEEQLRNRQREPPPASYSNLQPPTPPTSTRAPEPAVAACPSSAATYQLPVHSSTEFSEVVYRSPSILEAASNRVYAVEERVYKQKASAALQPPAEQHTPGPQLKKMSPPRARPSYPNGAVSMKDWLQSYRRQ